MEQLTHLKKMYKFGSIPFLVCSSTPSGHCDELGIGELFYVAGVTEEHAEASDGCSEAKIITCCCKCIVIICDSPGQQEGLVGVKRFVT